MGGLNKQGEEKNRVSDTAHDCPILRIGVMHEQPVSERENLSKWELFSFFHSLSLHHKEAIEARTQAISGYLTKELQDLNGDTIRTDIPTSSTVTDVIVWSIEQLGTDTFSATYEVDQQIKEGEQTSNVKATYCP